MCLAIPTLCPWIGDLRDQCEITLTLTTTGDVSSQRGDNACQNGILLLAV